MDDAPASAAHGGQRPAEEDLWPGVLWAVLGALLAFGLAVRVRHPATLGRHDVEALMASDRAGTTWLLGDRVLLAPSNDYYDAPMKRLIGYLAADPAYQARDDRTFVVRIP